MVKVAIDAMGGDFGPEPIVQGCALALSERGYEPVLVGNPEAIEPFLTPELKKRARIIEAHDVIGMHEGATDALRRKESSIYKAVDLVAKGEAHGVVSAGHSGATMSLSTLRIGRLPGVMRPAIATLMPTTAEGKHALVLDVGANVDSEAKHLVQFAVMGKAYATNVLKQDLPRVGLLANGEEPTKGDRLVKESHNLLKTLQDFNFIGNVEGGDIFKGGVDVVVCDGFVGNVLLKTGEGVADAMVDVLKRHTKKSPLSILGALLMRTAFKGLKKDMDYAEYGGAPLIGINGCSIISHGKSNPKAIKNAVLQAIRFTESGVNEQIVSYLERYQLTPQDKGTRS
jgi:glycerol-3-phosphate acyltransferase PlsX